MSDTNDWMVLVVEDEPDGQEVVSGILNYFNVKSQTASSAEEALQLLQDGDYTGVIIDLMLPGMHGTQLIGEIRDNLATANLPCVAITAYHTSVVRQEAIEAGFDAYFPKPLDEIAFFRAFSRLLSDN
jgi:CheY-like chemotaxis protein